MGVEFHREAGLEFDAAFEWYMERSPDAAVRFDAEVAHADHRRPQALGCRTAFHSQIPVAAVSLRSDLPGTSSFGRHSDRSGYSHQPQAGLLEEAVVVPRVHVDRDDLSAKFWLDPLQLAANFGFRAHEVREIQSIVFYRRAQLLEAWNEFFGSSGGCGLH